MAVALPSLACTIVHSAIDVGPNFKVQVRDRGRPVEGLAVEIFGGNTEQGNVGHVVLSDHNGVALFRDLPRGPYVLGVGAWPLPWKTVEVRVDPSRSSEVTVPVRWPEDEVIATRSLRGALHLWDSVPGQPQPSFELRLLHVVTGQILGTTNTDEDGAFEFAGFTGGLYFLRISPPGEGGLIPVEVRPDAEAAYIDLDVQSWPCLSVYLDRTTCPQIELHVAQLEGVVVDETGGVIGGAEVLLFDAADRLILQTLIGGDGRFSLPDLADGTYQLVVRVEGFTTMRGSVTVDSERGRSRTIVELGFAGRCSTVRIE